MAWLVGALAWLLLLWLLGGGVACQGSSGATTSPAPTDGGVQEIREGRCEVQPADGGLADGTVDADSVPFLRRIGCTADFEALASDPLTSALAGARSVKVVLDRSDGEALYFQNSVRYPVHFEFASAQLADVAPLGQFNQTEYFSPDRRFILAAVTFYAGPSAWTLEFAPYDTASAEMTTTLFRAVQAQAFFGPGLRLHPTSEARLTRDQGLPADVPLITTDELYAGISYQPLTLGRTIGRLHFVNAAELAQEYLAHEYIVVLDQAPNDISVVEGLITEEFQTPLSHINVLSQNRKTPNMGLRGAMSHPDLLPLKDQLVELVVGSRTWSIRPATAEEADAFWSAKAAEREPVVLPAPDFTVTELLDAELVAPDPPAGRTLRDQIVQAVLAFGGKTAQYSVLARMAELRVKPAFGIPVFYYDQFMRENGFYERMEQLLADEQFRTHFAVRDAELTDFRQAMLEAPVNEAFQDRLRAKLAEFLPAGKKARFRSSTNSEDLEGFPCAGCYESHTGDPANWESILDAIRETWASAWLFRTFEERNFYQVEHNTVVMGLLVHTNYPEEEANGVAVTGNIYDASGLDPAFYVNVQQGGEFEVVHPPPGVSSDIFLYYYSQVGTPVVYLSHSSEVPEGMHVLTARQIRELGDALLAIHNRFSAAYGPAVGNLGWYAMDVEFKFDNEAARSEPPQLYIKQARPYPQPGGGAAP